MDEKEILRRKIKLKRQAFKLIYAEKEELRQRFSLLRIRDHLLEKMNLEFDRELSQKIDCVDFVLLRN